jgi:hypothetical protein
MGRRPKGRRGQLHDSLASCAELSRSSSGSRHCGRVVSLRSFYRRRRERTFRYSVSRGGGGERRRRRVTALTAVSPTRWVGRELNKRREAESKLTEDKRRESEGAREEGEQRGVESTTLAAARDAPNLAHSPRSS